MSLQPFFPYFLLKIFQKRSKALYKGTSQTLPCRPCINMCARWLNVHNWVRCITPLLAWSNIASTLWFLRGLWVKSLYSHSVFSVCMIFASLCARQGCTWKRVLDSINVVGHICLKLKLVVSWLSNNVDMGYWGDGPTISLVKSQV